MHVGRHECLSAYMYVFIYVCMYDHMYVSYVCISVRSHLFDCIIAQTHAVYTSVSMQLNYLFARYTIHLYSYMPCCTYSHMRRVVKL